MQVADDHALAVAHGLRGDAVHALQSVEVMAMAGQVEKRGQARRRAQHQAVAAFIEQQDAAQHGGMVGLHAQHHAFQHPFQRRARGQHFQHLPPRMLAPFHLAALADIAESPQARLLIAQLHAAHILFDHPSIAQVQHVASLAVAVRRVGACSEERRRLLELAFHVAHERRAIGLPVERVGYLPQVAEAPVRREDAAVDIVDQNAVDGRIEDAAQHGLAALRRLGHRQHARLPLLQLAGQLARARQRRLGAGTARRQQPGGQRQHDAGQHTGPGHQTGPRQQLAIETRHGAHAQGPGAAGDGDHLPRHEAVRRGRGKAARQAVIHQGRLGQLRAVIDFQVQLARRLTAHARHQVTHAERRKHPGAQGGAPLFHRAMRHTILVNGQHDEEAMRLGAAAILHQVNLARHGGPPRIARLLERGAAHGFGPEVIAEGQQVAVA
ncbi:hypothetical protein D3C72_1210180 [compost metagenome]